MDVMNIRDRLSTHQFERITPGGSRSAAVLIPLLDQDGETCILFEKRSSDIPQGGEICFPGGRIDGERPDKTAVRETSEELLLTEHQIEVIAPLHTMSGPGGAEVYSFLGILYGYTGTFSPAEVNCTFTIPVRQLLENPPEVHHGRMCLETKEDFPYHMIPGGRSYPMRSVPRTFYFYPTEHGVIWGMTAELLYHFLRLVKG